MSTGNLEIAKRRRPLVKRICLQCGDGIKKKSNVDDTPTRPHGPAMAFLYNALYTNEEDQMPRGKGRIEMKYADPASQYICEIVPVTIDKLAEDWRGHKGYSIGNLLKRSRTEHWVKRRKAYQAKLQAEVERKTMEAQSEERTHQIEEASKRHREQAREMQRVANEFIKACDNLVTGNVKCPHCGKDVEVPAPEMKAGDAGRTAARLGKDGIELERKALGIAEKFEMRYQAETYVAFVYQILEKHVMQFPDIFRAMSEELTRFHEIEQDKIQTEIGPMVEMPNCIK